MPNTSNTTIDSPLIDLANTKRSVRDNHDHINHIETSDESVIGFVDRLIHNAIEKHISDIHLEPYQHYCRIRFRQDGLLHEVTKITSPFALRITLRLKVMANLNIAENRLPQDGRIQLRSATSIDIRINTCPTLFGEKIVLRILDTKQLKLDINALGYTNTQKEIFLRQLTKPQGLILVTGPTGSGKTMTLYAALQYINQIEKNIVSVEDPVEIELNGINQVSINEAIGLDFAAVLHTFLRQDPDVMMVGEIRDIKTANMAIQAAQTGHLVLSTLHTNNTIESIVRLTSMGISVEQLTSSLSLIIAQRLVRKLCRHCRIPLPSHYEAGSCEACHDGYLGRTGIFELLLFTKSLSMTLSLPISTHTILNQAQQEGYLPLHEVAEEKVKNGITTLSEINRVIPAY